MRVKSILTSQKNFFQSGLTKGSAFRIEKLGILRKAIIAHENDIKDALKKDLNKAPFEAYASEIGIVLEEIKYTIRHLKAWIKPQKARTPLAHFLSSSKIRPEPYGISLIMSPWNYPFQLTFAPLIGSMSAGNCSIVKPSAYSPATSAIIARIIKECFDEEYIAVIEGGREANQALLEEKFDYIFFTGSVSVGKTVMKAAAEYLTPVTLELGGKSPCIVDRYVNLDLAAKRIVWGKFMNAGQTCVAPDYLLVHKSVKKELFSHMERYIKTFYGQDPCSNPDFPRIISERHFKRLLGFLERGDIVTGGRYDPSRLVIAPTLIDNITWEDPVMQEEIFGPILPSLEFDDLAGVISMMSSRPKPLALYLFTSNKENESRIMEGISFGGGCVNDTIIHLATPHMPFGGVGESGMGGYHGKASFDTFSHKKSILKKSCLFDINLRYPPYSDSKLSLVKKVLG